MDTPHPTPLAKAQAKYREGRRKLPGTLIPADVLATLERVQHDHGIDSLAGAIWHVVRAHPSPGRRARR